MDTKEFYELVTGFFGDRAIQRGLVRSTGVFSCTLYESFRFECSLEEEHGSFNAGIEYSPQLYLTTFFGENLSLNSDRDSILQNLRTVDEWCRLHLPDKFLERYDLALGLDA